MGENSDIHDDEKIEQQIQSEQKKYDDLRDYFKSIGQERISRQIEDEKFTGQMTATHVVAIQSAIESEFLQKREDQIQEWFSQLHAKVIDEAQRYNNVVVTLGYASFFGIWSFVNQSLPDFDRVLIAFFLGVSILGFVVWTLALSVVSTLNLRKTNLMLTREFSSRDEFHESLMQDDLRRTKTYMRAFRFYPFVFIFCVVTGFSAGLLLFTHLGAEIIGKSFSILQLISE